MLFNALSFRYKVIDLWPEGHALTALQLLDVLFTVFAALL